MIVTCGSCDVEISKDTATGKPRSLTCDEALPDSALEPLRVAMQLAGWSFTHGRWEKATNSDRYVAQVTSAWRARK